MTKRLSLYITDVDDKQLNELAGWTGFTRSQLVRMAIQAMHRDAAPQRLATEDVSVSQIHLEDKIREHKAAELQAQESIGDTFVKDGEEYRIPPNTESISQREDRLHKENMKRRAERPYR